MVLGNTPRRETNIYVEANKSYAFGLRFQTPDEEPVDLTGCTVRLVATEPPHYGGTEVLNLLADMQAPTSGFAQFNMQAEDLALEPAEYAYDVTLIPQTDYSTPVIKGNITVGSNTDTDTSNKYLGVNVGSDITVTIENGDVVEIIIERVDGVYTIVSNLIKDFADAMQAEVDEAAGHASDSADSAALSASYAAEMQVWLDNAGYPFWKGTQAEYNAITPKREILYLITDPVVH